MKRILFLLMTPCIFISCNQSQKHIDDFNAIQRKELPSIIERDTNNSNLLKPREQDLYHTDLDTIPDK